MNQNDLSENLDHWDYISRYSQWMYHIYSDYVGQYIFDVGAGMGRMVEFYIQSAKRVVATDIFQNQIDYMNNRFRSYPYFNAVLMNILTDDLSVYAYSFDTVICINVLEHLSDDYKAVGNMKSVLKDGGKMVLLVPAFQKLYCQLDRNVSHYRRYDPGRLADIAEKNGMEILKHHYFNLPGIIPYWIKGKFKIRNGESFSSSLNQSNSGVYNLASRILEPIERYFPPKAGLTEVIILKK